MGVDGLPVVREAFARTVRLAATANLRPSVLSKLVDEDELAALSEIEGATSARLLAQARGIEGVPAEELVFGIPHGAFINAAFAYARPREPNRFNDASRGAWYAALEVETCLAEVGFHLTEALARTGVFDATVEYVELHASMAGEFVDLRGARGHPALEADPAVAYPAGVALARSARSAGLNGIIYPSVRRAGGTCIAALWPHAVQSVAQGATWRMRWAGSPAPRIERP